MKNSFVLFLFLCIWHVTFSQNIEWTKTVGGTGDESANSIVLDSNGNIYTIGYFNNTVDFDPGNGVFNLTSFGNSDIFILKLDSSGNFLWAKQFGGDSTDIGNSIAVSINGGIYFTGSFSRTSDFDPTSSVSSLISNGKRDVFVCKLDKNGNLLWKYQMGGSKDDEGKSLALSSAHVFITGNIGDDILITKLDSSGNLLWKHNLITKVDLSNPGWGYYRGYHNSKGNSIVVDSKETILITGYYNGFVDFDPGVQEFILKVDDNWIGQYYTYGDGASMFILKLSNSGNFVWVKEMVPTHAGIHGNYISLDHLDNI
ncbi:MAG: SBBP repeat-containing protein, partial [Cytophagales bacterium]|nr:SBBP repeat-containing protein [Cytophagales bacterium]